MRFIVAIPVYNEEEYVQSVLDCVKRFSDDVLVINDGSSDESSRIAREAGVKVLDHPTNQGYGRALRSAFAYAADNDYDVVVTMDADKQHLPRHIPVFLHHISDCDIVSGSRYLSSNPEDTAAPEERALVNRTITKRIDEATGYRLTDSFCGFKAYRVEALKKLALREDGYAMPLELWIQAAANGLRVKEIPVSLIYLDPNRSFGQDLDKVERRLAYYNEVIDREVARVKLESAGRSMAVCCGGYDEVCCSPGE